MIVRVAIHDLVIVRDAVFEPGAGLTAVTGETGAGKTLLATAVSLLFGGDADAGQVAPGATHAFVEGEFEVDDAFWAHPDVEALRELRPEDDAPLVLARRIDATGRSRALAWGRTISRRDLAAAGELLLATAGQHVQVRLRSPAVQRELLDRAGDEAHRELAAQVRAAWDQLRGARCAHEELVALVEQGAAHAEQLREDLARIDSLAPSPEDEEALLAQRDRSRHHATLVQACSEALAALDGSDRAGAIDRAGEAYAAAASAADHDPQLAELASGLLAAQETLVEAASGLGSRLGDLAEGPAPLDEIEDRLAAYDDAKRRFGGTTASVIATWEQLRARSEAIDGSDEALTASATRLAEAVATCSSLAARLTAGRAAIATVLSVRVAELLAELGMESSVFEVVVDPAELGEHGADRVELRLAPVEGVVPRPVAQVASGGELSRIALALLVATDADGVDTILFDEIDAGIGGRTAHAVGSMLRRLADHRQVVCITHLPQVAARADAHVVIEKAHVGDEVRTTLRSLPEEQAVLDELVRMLGADPGDEPALEHARQLRGPRFDLAGTRSTPGVPSDA